MVIEYTATPKDIAALYSYTRAHSPKLQLVFYGMPIVLAGIVLAGRLSPGHKLTLVDLLVALAWGAAFFFMFPLFLRFRTKKDKRTLSIQPDKLSTRVGALSGEIPWVKVDSLYVTDEHIFMIGKNMNGFAIPSRAFIDDTQRKEFIRLCEQYIHAAKAAA
jgi:hypothetical protein